MSLSKGPIKKISQGDLATIKSRVVAVNDQLADLGYTFDEMIGFWEGIIQEWKTKTSSGGGSIGLKKAKTDFED